MDPERDEELRRYQLCWLAFASISLGLGLLFIDAGCNLAFLLTFNPELRGLLRSSGWEWGVGAPITWGTVIGSYLLLGRSEDPTWRRRAGLLVVMNGIDLLFWTISHLDELGLGPGYLEHAWLPHAISSGLGWAEFMLFAMMAAEMAAQLGRPEVHEHALSARSICTIGLMLWAIEFVSRTDWAHGWPLEAKPIGPRTHLLILGSTLLLTIGAFQVTLLCLSACRMCGRTLARMRAEYESHDLLRSRSEPFDDDRDRWFDEQKTQDPWA